MQELLKDKKKVIILLLVLAVIIILLSISVSFFQSQRQLQGSDSNSELLAIESQGDVRPIPLYPKVTVKNWTESNTAVPTASVSTINTYSFKQNYNVNEIKVYIDLFGMEEVIAESTETLAYTVGESEDDISAFVFQNRTGEFSYYSNTGITYNGSTSSAKAQNLVQNIFKDPTVQFFASYKDIGEPSVTFFEFHRNWQAVGLPILNALGIFNIGQNIPLDSLRLGDSRFSPADVNIISTSNNTNGLARNIDFNTITVGISDNLGTVLSVTSNMRKFDENSPAEAATLITYEEALENLKANKYEFLYTAPSGEGVPSFDKVYPSGRASAANAVITDSIVTYLEENIEEIQNTLEPYYLFKGTTKLDSGYNVDFVAAVKAQIVSE